MIKEQLERCIRCGDALIPDIDSLTLCDPCFLDDCESICFECASVNNLTILHDGVALCEECLKNQWNDNVIDRWDESVNRKREAHKREVQE